MTTGEMAPYQYFFRSIEIKWRVRVSVIERQTGCPENDFIGSQAVLINE